MDRSQLIEAMQQAAAAAAKPRPVEVSWGTVYVRDVSVAEVSAQQAAAGEEEQPADKSTGLARAACRVLCDENGQRLLDDKNPEDVALVSSQPWSVLQVILSAADSTGKA